MTRWATLILAAACTTAPEPELDDPRIAELEQAVAELKVRVAELEAAKVKRARPARERAPPEPVPGIHPVDEYHYEISREHLDGLLDLEEASKLGRALLHRGDDGEFDGYRLSSIRRNTLADQLGIKNGDIVHRINGHQLNSVQGAMDAYQALKDSDHFEVEITRRSNRHTLIYELE